MSDGLNSVNNFLRTMLGMVVVGGLGAAGWYGYTTYNKNDLAFAEKDRQLEAAAAELSQAKLDLEAKNAEIGVLNQEVERLDTSIRLLKMDSRVARLRVLDKKTDAATGALTTTVEFVELDDQGNEIGEPKVVAIEGDQIYIDYWVVKFDDKYVEQADLDRATSIALFRRIFSEQRKPEEGFTLDDPNSMPAKYAQGTQPSEHDKNIWADFWTFANDRAAAEAKGIRAAHGEAVSMKLETGRTYRVALRASDGLSIVPEETPVGTTSAEE